MARSWDGERAETIAEALHCNPQTVRRRIHRFDAEGIDGLGDRPKRGRLVTQRDGSMVVRDEEGEAQWSLNALAQAAKEAGIVVKRSQIRTILVREGVRWRHTHSWGTAHDKDFVPKERRSSATTRIHQQGRRRVTHRPASPP